MIVDGDHVTRFAAHLPLSTNFMALAGVGTRHSAALGLAELTDALCIVSSEERGEISIARDGRLRRLSDPATLTAELDRFLHEVRPGDGERRSFWSQLIREHWAEKVASLALRVGALAGGGSRGASAGADLQGAGAGREPAARVWSSTR